MTELKELNEAELDRNLRTYHADDKCYVSGAVPRCDVVGLTCLLCARQCYCGNTLVAINPFKHIPGLYDNPVSTVPLCLDLLFP